MNIIVKELFGSHLYGLNTPESDKDYKGVFIPSPKEIVLSMAPKAIDVSTNKSSTKNTSADTDEEYYSLLYFVQNALKGETFAIDMLHMHKNGDPIWDYLVENRKRFYSTDMKAFVGYARRQAAKYSIKGSRLDFLEKAVKSIKDLPKDDRISEHEDKLLTGEFASIEEDDNGKYYHPCGKKFYFNDRIWHVTESLSKIRDGYGKRAQQAKENKGVDFKAVSHALRAAYQLRDIFKHGDFEYPLKETEFLAKVKAGKLDFTSEVQPELESVIEEVEGLSKESSLPSKPNVDFWMNFVYAVYLKEIKGETV